MAQPIANYQEFFANAKNAIAETAALTAQEEKLKDEETGLRNSLESEQKALKDSIELTIKKRSAEVSETYDVEIRKAQDALKKVKDKRERARNIGMRERIKEETCGLRNANTTLKKEMKTAYRKQNISAFCTTRLYYALYFPHRMTDALVLLGFILICFLAVPCGVYFFALPHKFRQPLFLALIYVAVILIFGGLYTIIGNVTKNRHLEMLKSGRQTYDEISANKKRIREITRNIEHDKSEDKYNLAGFDDEIAHINQQLADATMKKQDALNTFNSVTKNIITDELTSNAKPKIDELTQQLAETVKKGQDVGNARHEKALALSDQYEVYLGKEFMDPGKIDELANIMSHGTAANLTEAIDEYRNRADG